MPCSPDSTAASAAMDGTSLRSSQTRGRTVAHAVPIDPASLRMPLALLGPCPAPTLPLDKAIEEDGQSAANREGDKNT